MRVLFIDSDVLLDTILIREPHFNDSVAVLELADGKNFSCCTSVHSLLNIHYSVKKAFGEKSARQAIKILIEKLMIIKEDVNTLEVALRSTFSDFEDAVQYCVAQEVNADAIVTRNIKDYKQSSIRVLTPVQFLKTL